MRSTWMNSSPRPYLNVTLRQSSSRGIRTTSSCSTLTHSTGPIPSGKSKTSGSENGSVVYQPRSRSQIERRIETLLDRRPDRERGGEGVAVDDDVRSVTDADLVDRRKEVIRGVPGEYVRQPRLDPDADEGEQPGFLPALVLCELRVAELDAGLLVRPLGMRLRQRHRHVQIRTAGLEGGREDLGIQARIDRVQNHVRVGRPGCSNDCALVRGVELERGESIRLAEARNRTPGALEVHVRKRHVVEEGPVLRDRRDGGSDASRTDHQHPHSCRGSPIRPRRSRGIVRNAPQKAPAH